RDVEGDGHVRGGEVRDEALAGELLLVDRERLLLAALGRGGDVRGEHVSLERLAHGLELRVSRRAARAGGRGGMRGAQEDRHLGLLDQGRLHVHDLLLHEHAGTHEGEGDGRDDDDRDDHGDVPPQAREDLTEDVARPHRPASSSWAMSSSNSSKGYSSRSRAASRSSIRSSSSTSLAAGSSAAGDEAVAPSAGSSFSGATSPAARASTPSGRPSSRSAESSGRWPEMTLTGAWVS